MTKWIWGKDVYNAISMLSMEKNSINSIKYILKIFCSWRWNWSSAFIGGGIVVWQRWGGGRVAIKTFGSMGYAMGVNLLICDAWSIFCDAWASKRHGAFAFVQCFLTIDKCLL